MVFKRSSRFSGSAENKAEPARVMPREETTEREETRSSERTPTRTTTQRNGKSKFQAIGHLTSPKSATDEERDLAMELRDSKIRLNLSIYLPKGVKELTLKNKDIITVSFKKGLYDQDFVIGTAFIAED